MAASIPIDPPASATNLAPIVSAQVTGRFGGGGAERLAHNLAAALHEQGWKSSCIAVCELGSYARDSHDVPAFCLGLRSPLSLLSAIRKLRRIVREQSIQCIHIHGVNCMPFCAAAFFGMRRRPLMLFTWHTSGATMRVTGIRGMVNRWAMRRYRTLFGPSAAIVEQLRKVAPAGVETAVFRNGVPRRAIIAAIDQAEPVICWYARLVPSKDPSLLIRAAAALKREGLRFRVVLAGDPMPNQQWFADQIKAEARTLGVRDIIEFPGWIDDVTELLERSAIGVQTSRAEGLSMTLLEQMMAGLAVIATNVGDTAVAVEDGVSGFVIPPQDESALIDRLRRLLSDPALRRNIGLAAHERAQTLFSLEAMARQAMKEYARAT